MNLFAFALAQVGSKLRKLGVSKCQQESLSLGRGPERFLLTAPRCEGRRVSGRNKDIDGVTVTNHRASGLQPLLQHLEIFDEDHRRLGKHFSSTIVKQP